MKFLLPLLLVFCAPRQHARIVNSTDSIVWEYVIGGQQCMIENPEQHLLSTSEDFNTLWKRAFGSMDMPPDKPVVDFSRYQVVALFLGWRNKGGYALELEDISLEESRMIIRFVEKEPGPMCLTPAVVVFPYLLVKVPKADCHNSAFLHRKVIIDCR